MPRLARALLAALGAAAAAAGGARGYGGLNIGGEHEDAEVVAVTKQILCRVCETAVLEVAGKARRERVTASEEALGDLAEGFCPKDNQIHNALPGYEAVPYGRDTGRFVFRARHGGTPGVPPARQGYVHDYLNRGVQYACQLSVAEHDSELAEALWRHFRAGPDSSLAVVKREYCYRIGACRDKARDAREREERVKLEQRRAPEVARERAEEAAKVAARESAPERRPPPAREL